MSKRIQINFIDNIKTETYNIKQRVKVIRKI